MKKRITAIIILLLLPLSIIGCAVSEPPINTPDTQVANVPQETTSPTASPTSPPETSAVPSAEILVSRDDYTITRIDGHCYLDLKDGNVHIDPYTGGCVIPASSILFTSVEELYEWLAKGDLSKENLEAIQYGFPLDKERGFLLPDPEKLCTLLLPAGYEVRSLNLQGETCTFYIHRKKSTTSNSFLGTFSLTTQAYYEDGLAYFERFTSGRIFENSEFTLESVREDTEKDAVIYDYQAPAGKYRSVLYSLKTARKTLYIMEQYLLDSIYDISTESDTVPVSLLVYGMIDDHYISFHSSSMNAAPMRQWLTNFDLTAFDTNS